MAEMMNFPNKFEDFIDRYNFEDKKEIYTNGSELIPTFRVMQGWDHYMNQFRTAYTYCDGDVHVFGHYCKKILKDMGELW